MKRNLVFALILFTVAIPPKKKITIWMIGDSTMAIKNPKAFPETGWGMPFVYFWDSTVTVDNRAMNGRSTRTFLEEKRWDPIMQNMQEGDWVFIQFGHNDEVPTKKSYVDEAGFKANLLKYINETKSKKANPVLLTPVARRKFDANGNVEETHAVYAQVVRDIAKENNVPMIDLAEKGKELYRQFGQEASKYLLNHLAPGEHPNYPEGKVDDTHFSELGARKIASIVLAEIRKQHLALEERIIVKSTAK